MQKAKLETQSPKKDMPRDMQETAPAELQPKADATDAAWTEEMMQWAIASSTCGGLPHKEDKNDKDNKDANKENKDSKDQNEDKPACP